MRTFENLDRHLGLLPPNILNAIARIEAGRGQAIAFRRQNPFVLDTLKEIAMVQSVEASNAIENIRVSHRRVKALVLDKTTPQDRSESEIAGYRRVLDEIHTNGENIPFTLNVVLQLHGWLFSFLPDRAGVFKLSENEVIETRPDGTEVVRFQPVKRADTPRFMDELHERFDRAWAEGTYHRLLLIGAYVFDFLMIHPFQDGNGRMSRLLTSLLQHQSDYQVGRYVSWEKLIDDSRETYYESLRRSTVGWHESQHDLEPWLGYFLGVLVAAYRELEDRTEQVSVGRGFKTAMVESFVRTNLSDKFSIEDIRRKAPGVSDVQIGRVLRDLKQRKVIELEGRGRSAKWRRLTTEF